MTTQTDSKLRAAIDRLPRHIDPARDLWPGIAQSIERQARPKPRPAWTYAMAASLMIGVGAAGMWFALTQRATVQPANLAQATVGAGGDESAYFAQRAAFAEHSVETAPNLAPATRTVILNNLKIIENSIGQIQGALAKDPSNPQLQGLLLDLYQDESRLLSATQNVQMQHAAVRTSL